MVWSSDLVKEGAKVYLTDIHEDKLAAIKADFGAITLVKPDEVYDLDVDIYSPCALGCYGERRHIETLEVQRDRRCCEQPIGR